MELAKALDQIAEIHDQIAKGEVYKGYRPAPVAASGAGGFVAAGLQSWFVVPGDGESFLRYWTVAGLLCGLVAATGILYNYVAREDSYTRRRSRRVLAQFVPSLAAAVALTAAFSRMNPVPVALLPGLWALLFGLGIFSSRPYLPRAAGWLGLYYLAAGSWLLLNAGHPAGPGYWGVGLGLVFGLGQLASALMLHLNIERSSPRAEEI